MKGHRFTSRFKKDLRRVASQGKVVDRITDILIVLVSDDPLVPALKDHPLSGNWIGSRELHIEPDWLLIYKTTDELVTLERTGSHAELF